MMGYRQTSISFILSICLSWLLVPTLALSNQRNLDEPPPRTNGRSAGSRGCSNDEPIVENAPPGIILLAPNQDLVRTTSSNPSFAWFIRDSKPRQVQFRLYEENITTKKYSLIKEIEDKNFQSKSGIMVLPMPKNVILKEGGKYLWQVELICDRRHPSGNLFAEAELQVISVKPEFKNQLREAVSQSKQAKLYAKTGFDYDALMTILMVNKSDFVQKKATKQLKNSLLDKVATKPSELESLQNSSIYLIAWE
ncbi:protein of unknown function (DUF928) [Rivularia sp. PCC 7116]|uniref:DUF928 domain-containing protein n=1 Tax=Rivularia sp. PCC 7116 TaxID=373994 RepID=UPI00029F2203|nr:DUF928 domain-containing protein [Rivularia sp. PCC 7116]AFY57186.1 protein of unknown function (DUF928) [Rivularia sp. PCC 7116]